MNLKKVLIVSVFIWLVGTVFGMLTCGWLFRWVYAIPPNIWKDPATMMSIGNMVTSNLLGLAISIIFTSVYVLIQKGIPGKGVRKGINYGLVLWLTGVLAGMATMPLYMTIATAVVIYWIIQALVLNVIKGAIVGAIYK